METLKVVLNPNRGAGEAERKGYDPSADGEIAPDAKNKNPGDGWSNYGEWRGIFKTQAKTKRSHGLTWQKKMSCIAPVQI